MNGMIRRAGIVGAGTMGRITAFLFTRAGIDTTVLGRTEEKLRSLTAAVRSLLSGRVPEDAVERTMARLQLTTHLEECALGAELVLELVPEKLEVKREVMAAIGRAASETAIVASGASAIPPSWLAPSLPRPKRLVSLNFSGPDDLKVDVMGHPGTDPEVFARAVGLVRQLGLVPIPVSGELVGYTINRVWRAVKKECFFLVERGHSTPELIDRGFRAEFGVPLGPFAIMDRVGLDVILDVERVYFQASREERDRPPKLLEEMVAAGKLGEKSGEGFYRYPDPAWARPGFLKGE